MKKNFHNPQLLTLSLGSFKEHLFAQASLLNKGLMEESMEEKIILIVSNSATTRQLLILSMRKLNWPWRLNFVEAVDGKDGYEKFQVGQFNLVMTDIKMPNMTGLDLVGKLRDELGNKTVGIIIVGTKDEAADIKRGMSLGANEYLMKPPSTMQLQQVINRILV